MEKIMRKVFKVSTLVFMVSLITVMVILCGWLLFNIGNIHEDIKSPQWTLQLVSVVLGILPVMAISGVIGYFENILDEIKDFIN